jgi:hypothetical protein
VACLAVHQVVRQADLPGVHRAACPVAQLAAAVAESRA